MMTPEMLQGLSTLVTTLQEIRNAVILQNCISAIQTSRVDYEFSEFSKHVLEDAYEVWLHAAGEGLLPYPPARKNAQARAVTDRG